MVWIPGFGKYSPRMGNRVGDKAPDFTLQDQDGRSVHLAEELGHRPVVLVFYPMAGSPVCTRQMCSLRDGWPELMSNAKVFGISYDSVQNLQRFKEQEHLPFPLLSDPDKAVAEAVRRGRHLRRSARHFRDRRGRADPRRNRQRESGRPRGAGAGGAVTARRDRHVPPHARHGSNGTHPAATGAVTRRLHPLPFPLVLTLDELL